MTKRKCYRCYKTSDRYKIIKWNKNTLNYKWWGETTLICANCEAFLRINDNNNS